MGNLRSFDYSELENLKIDMETINYLSKIHEYKGRQDLYIRQKPAELDKMVEIAKIQSTESSNSIEGIFSTSTRIRELVKEKTTPRNRSEKEIVGYKDVLNTIHESHDVIPIEGRYILQLHRDLMRPAGFSYGGSYKNTQNYINETLPDRTQTTRFTPVAPYETAGAIDAICESFNREIALEKIDPLILVPCFIIDFLCIHPFNEGNGRSTRIWLDHILKNEIGKVIDWSKVDKEDYLLAMERSPIKDIEIKYLLKNALTDEINSREVYMKGIDHSYYYEGYITFKAEDL